jgi:hypothetical protein
LLRDVIVAIVARKERLMPADMARGVAQRAVFIRIHDAIGKAAVVGMGENDRKH